MQKTPPVCDYEGSDYRTRFWEGQGRSYEDQAERVALRRLMPPTGGTLLDIGAGFGRLADEYSGYREIVLLDYSSSLLREAREQHGNDPRIRYVAANWYQMPFVDGLFDTLVQVRTLHHAADVPALFGELARIGRPGGSYVLEFANKRNLKAIGRWLLRRQNWSPFDPAPIEFVPLNYDFHPAWIESALHHAGFLPRQQLTVSRFRIPLLKRIVPTRWLVALDRMLQPTGAWWQLTPSVFVRNAHPRQGQGAPAGHFFACPHCREPLIEEGESATCPACNLRWNQEDGIWNFKEAV
jgi:SAM-dependent methyltransferase